MNVRELIEQLSKCNPETRVMVFYGDPNEDEILDDFTVSEDSWDGISTVVIETS